MIPGYLDVVPELPRTTSGKVDRNQLPPPETALVRASGARVAPQTELERQIVGVWQETLGTESISVTDDFFLDLGGHSLVAARMATRLRQRISRTVTVRDAYECPTVRALAERLESLSVDDTDDTDDGVDGSAPQAARPTGSRAVFQSTPRWERLSTFALQALSMYVMAAMAIAPLGMLFLLGRDWFYGGISTWRLVVLAVAVILLTCAGVPDVFDRRQVGDHRPVQTRRLSAVGPVLLALVALQPDPGVQRPRRAERYTTSATRVPADGGAGGRPVHA